MRISVLSVAVACPFLVIAQFTFISPNSAAYDPIYDTYYVAEAGSPWAIERIVSGFPQSWVGTAFLPRDLLVKGDSLFCVHASGGLVGWRFPSTGADINVNVGFGQVLWGLATDGHWLYATDRDDQSIWKINSANGSNTFLSLSLGWEPCGIVYDPVNDRLLVGSWGSNAGIYAIDLDTGADTLLLQTPFTNIHGITIDCLGRILISTWFPDQVVAYTPGLNDPGEVLFSGLSNPGFIHFDHYHNELLIPNTQSGMLMMEPINCSTGSVEMVKPQLRVFPNPAREMVRLEVPENALVEFVDAYGRLVLQTVVVNGSVDVSCLGTGSYFIRSGPKTTRLMIME